MNLKNTWIPFIFAMLLLIPIRIYQITVMGHSVWSFSFPKDFTSYALIFLIIVFVLTIIIMSFTSKNVPNTIKIEKNILSGIFSLIAGLLAIKEGVADMFSVLMELVEQENAFKIAVLGAADVIGGIVFVMIFINLCFAKNLFKTVPIITLIPTLWAGVRLMYNTSMESAGKGIFDIFALIFLLLFLFAQARMFVNVEGKNIPKRIFAFGLSAAIFISLYSIPVFYFGLFEVDSNVSSFYEYSIIDMSLCFYILTFLISVTKYLDVNFKKDNFSNGYMNNDNNTEKDIKFFSNNEYNSENMEQFIGKSIGSSQKVPDSMIRKNPNYQSNFGKSYIKKLFRI